VADSNVKKTDIHFAIHSNANEGKTRGGEVFCHRFGGEGEGLNGVTIITLK
jgi:N-acetylmuramoyl-L-alanine amidase